MKKHELQQALEKANELIEKQDSLILDMVGALKVVKKDKYLFPDIWEKLKEMKIS